MEKNLLNYSEVFELGGALELKYLQAFNGFFITNSGIDLKTHKAFFIHETGRPY